MVRKRQKRLERFGGGGGGYVEKERDWKLKRKEDIKKKQINGK
jgi:hypothetical protein